MITQAKTPIDFARLRSYLESVPFCVNQQRLYTGKSLYKGYNPERPESFDKSYDLKVYHYFIDHGKQAKEPLEAFARSIHDFHIMKQMQLLLKRYPRTRVAGVMGGNAMLRTDESYLDVVRLSKRLTEEGFLMCSGGGSGAMEATNLGGMLAGRSEAEMLDAVAILRTAPSMHDAEYFVRSFEVLNKYPRLRGYYSLSIPTWLYGHEPTNPFASHIAKLFDNSIREDTLLTIAYGGIIYSPGSAGTIQEIFQDALQNQYNTLGVNSPMVFLNKKYWTEKVPIYSTLERLHKLGTYNKLQLTITDDFMEASQVIIDFDKQQRNP